MPAGGTSRRRERLARGGWLTLTLTLGLTLDAGGLRGAQALAQAQAQERPGERGATQAPRFTPPVLVTRVSGEYPKEALDAGLEGTVTLEFTVDETGAVGEVVVKTPGGHGFDEAAVAAVKRFTFKPAENDGTPVPARVTYAYKFVLKRVTRVVPASEATRPPDRGAATPAPGPEPPPPPRIKGVVLARGTRALVAGAHVTALLKQQDAPKASQPRAEAETAADGSFELRGLPDGPWVIVVSGSGIEKTTFEETLGRDQVLTVRYYVASTWSSRFQSTVRGAQAREEVSRQILTTEELVKMPGTMGDALRAVENLPGVARAPFNTGLIIIRGGKPTDSRSFLAGSEVPQLYHFGGGTSVVPSTLVERVDYLAGNFPVRYGRSIAGIIDVELREGKRDRLHGWIDVNAFDAGAGIEGPVGKGSFVVSARRSYIDGLLQLASAAGILPSLGLKFTTAPVYYDYQAIFDHPLGGGKFRAMVYGSDDTLRLVFDNPASADPGIRGNFSTHIYFHKLQLRWTRTMGAWSVMAQTSAGFTGTDGVIGDGRSFGAASVGDDSRLEARWQISPSLRLLVGADTQYGYTHLTAVVPSPVREGEQPLPLSAVNAVHADERISSFSIGAYAELAAKVTGALTVTPGLRFDYYDTVRRMSFNPRLGAAWQVAAYTRLKGGVGLYSQDPQAQDYDAAFGNPKLRPENAMHYSLGVEQGLYPGLMLELTGFYKSLYDLVVTSNQRILKNGIADVERTSNLGDGRVYGGELLLRQSISKWFFGWIAYTLMRSERRNCADCSWRPFDYDQTHIFVIALHAYLPKGFEAGLRFRYISGNPVTYIRSATYDADADVYVPGRFPTNTERLDAFHQLDIRIDKVFTFKTWELKVYLDLTNVYNHANSEQLQYSYDYKKAVPLTGLPFLPSFGIRGDF